MRLEPARPLWHCPPRRVRTSGEGPWCARMPCQGHRASGDQLAVARVLAWQDGLQLAELRGPDHDQQLSRARQALHDSGPGLGVPR